MTRATTQCPTCASELGSDERFCPICGQRLIRESEPDGGTAIELGGEFFFIASFPRRLGAFLIDSMVSSTLVSGAYLAYLVAPSPPSALTLTWWSAIWTVAVLGFEVFGTSPGKRAAGIRATRIDGHRPGAVHGFVRTGIKALSVGAFGVGCLWALSDRRRRTWHDRAASTVVVRVRSEQHFVDPPLDDFDEATSPPLVLSSRTSAFALLAAVILAMPYVANFYLPRLAEVSEAYTVLYQFDPVHPVPSSAELAAIGFPEPRPDACDGRTRRVCLVQLGDTLDVSVEVIAEQLRDEFGVDVEVLSPLPLGEEYRGQVVNEARGQLNADGALDLMVAAHPSLVGDTDVLLIGITPHDIIFRTDVYYTMLAGRDNFALMSSARLDPDAYGDPDRDLLAERMEKLARYELARAYFRLGPEQTDPPLPAGLVWPSDVDSIPDFALPTLPLTFEGTGSHRPTYVFEVSEPDWRACAELTSGGERQPSSGAISVARQDAIIVGYSAGSNGPGPIRCVDVSEPGLYYLTMQATNDSDWRVRVDAASKLEDPAGTLSIQEPPHLTPGVEQVDLAAFRFTADGHALDTYVPVRDFQLCWTAMVTDDLPGGFRMDTFLRGGTSEGAWEVSNLRDGDRGCLVVEARQVGDYQLTVSEMTRNLAVTISYEFGGLPLRDDAPVSVSVGDAHACALTDSGDIFCWGANDVWQLGFAEEASPDLRLTRSVELPGPANSVAAGAGFTCAAIRGAPYCWGLGISESMAFALDLSRQTAWQPTQVRSAYDTLSVAAGYEDACALKGTRDIECWGFNSYGQLGSEAEGVKFNVIPFTNPVAEIAVGGSFTCVLTASPGEIHCFGLSENGRLGVETTELSVPRPQRVELPLEPQTITAGFEHACALLADASLWCWGSNAAGQLQARATAFSPVPLLIDVPPLVGASAGVGHTCGLTESGEVWCWGANDFGQLGTSGLEAGSMEPVRIEGLPQIIAIDAGWLQTCAISIDHEVWCWGGLFGHGIGVGDWVPRRIVLRDDATAG